MGKGCMDPGGKEWVDRKRVGDVHSSTHGSIRIDFKPTIGSGDQKNERGRTGRKEPSENRKERGINQIT